MAPIVAGELVGPPEGPVAPLPRTAEGFFPCVNPAVGLEVGALGVHLCTAGVVAAVHLLELAV